jgi:hypothetical protein
VKFRGFALSCAAALVLAACSRPQEASNFHLATVAVSPEHRLLFIAQPGFPTIDVLRLAGSEEGSGQPRHVRRLAGPPRAHVVRLSVDRARARLWVVDFRVTQVYALPGLEELRRYELPTDKYHERFNDLAIDTAGNAFVLARGGARIYRIDGRSLRIETWLDLDDEATDAALLLANRILASPDDRHVYLTSPTRGGLVRIEMDSKRVTALSGDSSDLTCGLLFWDAGSSDMRAFDCTDLWDARIAIQDAKPGASLILNGRPRVAGAVARFDR